MQRITGGKNGDTGFLFYIDSFTKSEAAHRSPPELFQHLHIMLMRQTTVKLLTVNQEHKSVWWGFSGFVASSCHWSPSCPSCVSEKKPLLQHCESTCGELPVLKQIIILDLWGHSNTLLAQKRLNNHNNLMVIKPSVLLIIVTDTEGGRRLSDRDTFVTFLSFWLRSFGASSS